jgi:cyclohexanecarboxylate-CoA ligase
MATNDMATNDGSAAARDARRAEWRVAGWYPDLTLAEAIARGAALHGDDGIVFAPVDGDAVTVTLGDLSARAAVVARRLVGAGVRPGDRVVLQAPADAASTAVLVALWNAGAVAVPMTTMATNDELAHAVRETGARMAVAATRWRDRNLVENIATHRTALGLRTVVSIGAAAPTGALALDTLDESAPSTSARAHPAGDACVLYTSGSTAMPKGVRHSHETLLSGLMIVPAVAASRMLCTFPAGHVAALLGLLRPLVAGGTTVVMDRWSARAAAELIEEHRLTVSAGTPFFLSTLLDEAERSGRDISSLSRFLVGAATVPPALVERAETAGMVSWRTYGSTEHPSISAGSPDDPSEKRRCTDGRVAPGNEVRLVDENGLDVGPGAEGEIVARGPKQFVGYQDRAADDAAFFDSTWFRTGDLARFDDDGYLVVTDRVKDIIIRGGENISAREVEEAVALHAAVADVAVCAAPDEVWGEAVCAFVVVSAGRDLPSLADLGAHARDCGLAAHKLPTRMVVVDELPRTPAGKVRKRELRDLV